MTNELTLIEQLQKGEEILCDNCKKGFYTTPITDKSKSSEFRCNQCGNVIRISLNIIIE